MRTLGIGRFDEFRRRAEIAAARQQARQQSGRRNQIGGFFGRGAQQFDGALGVHQLAFHRLRGVEHGLLAVGRL